MRRLLICLVCSSLPIGSSAAQSSRFSLTPQVGYAVVGTFYEGMAQYDDIAVDVLVDPENHLVVGADLGIDLPGSPWGLHGQMAYGKGDASAHFCISGGSCEEGGGDVTSLLMGLGIRRGFSVGAGRLTEVGVRAGASMLRLSFGRGGESDTYYNPGILAGVDAGVALSSRATFVLGVENAFTRSDTDAFEKDFEAVEGGDLRLNRAWTNMTRVTAAVRFRL